MTARFLELWPALLTKALIKVAALDYGGGSGTQEFGDFSPIHCLTGWLPQTIAVRRREFAAAATAAAAARGSRLRLVLQRQQTSAAPAGLSGRWRRQERTTRGPRPLLPAEPPGTAHQASGSAAEASAAAPAETPAWQLIRPRPRRRPTVPLSDLPRRSGSDNDSDDGERAEAPRMMQRRLRQFEPLEIESPFFDYM
uniref:Uncharacterized protein n=1 Tax=Macrostomum lignano TaxID=282301 RepID=A0A1I8FFU2_9PLAT